MNVTIGNRDYSEKALVHAATRLNVSVDELRQKLEAAAQGANEPAAKLRIRDAAGFSELMAQGSSCVNIDFDIGVVAIKGTIAFTPGPDWKVAVDLHVFLIGIEVEHVQYTFTGQKAQVCYSVDVGVANLQLCLGVRNFCFFTSGKACALGSCKSWDENILCLAG